ncbi:MAG: hypothetical protein QXT27_07310 [Pyrobaculum sp.]
MRSILIAAIALVADLLLGFLIYNSRYDFASSYSDHVDFSMSCVG